jgi:hypothetical protein
MMERRMLPRAMVTPRGKTDRVGGPAGQHGDGGFVRARDTF